MTLKRRLDLGGGGGGGAAAAAAQTRLAEVGQDRVRRAAATHHLGDGDDDAEGLSVAKLSVK